ncbi:Myoglobin [Arthrobotrys entomopaga]|nr:Myoglobin [Arthrobotrys entomopaga]
MVTLPIPKLEDYSISPVTGFLPDLPPLTVLQNPYYAPWEATVSNLQALILSKKIRHVIDKLPILSPSHLETEGEWRRAYVILSFLSHSYIWGDNPSEVLPPSISIPYLSISAKLEVPPVASYAAVCLWNFKPIFADEPFDCLDNLATLHTFTGALDESWFYIVSVAIEARGAAVLPLMLKAIHNARNDDLDLVISALQLFAERLGELSYLLGRMYENCDPHIFYSRIRPYLAGSKNMAEAGLPRGVKYLDGTGNEDFRHYSGGSNAQSSLIQAFDILLGVEHRPTGENGREVPDDRTPSAKESKTHNFILEMRDYMPGPHRRFLEHLAQVSNIKNYVELHSSSGALTVAYDACLHMLKGFRDKHIQIVSRYIILPAKDQRVTIGDRIVSKHKQIAPSPSLGTTLNIHPTQPKGLARAPKNQSDLRGTGGTALIPFLKQARDETGEPSIGAWARRLLTSSGITPLGRDVGSIRIQGLAGQWLDSEDVGGICHW